MKTMKKGLTEAIKELEKRYGEGTVTRYGSENPQVIDVISTGSPSIDIALGIKGLPKGRITEIYGAESSAKTTLALQTIAQAQKSGDTCALIDVEHAADITYAAGLGVDVENLLISQPASAEETLEIVETLVNSEEVDLIVIDSVAAMTPQAEINGEFGDAQMGLIARTMSQGCRKLTAPISDNNVCVIFINQTRANIGVTWGSKSTTTGGKALKFYSSIRLELVRIGSVKDGDEIIGNRTKVKVVKNKLAPPAKECELDVIFGEGFSKEADVLATALGKGIIEQKGSWFSYGETRLGQGKENIRKQLIDNPGLCEELIEKIYAV